MRRRSSRGCGVRSPTTGAPAIDDVFSLLREGEADLPPEGPCQAVWGSALMEGAPPPPAEPAAKSDAAAGGAGAAGGVSCVGVVVVFFCAALWWWCSS